MPPASPEHAQATCQSWGLTGQGPFGRERPIHSARKGRTRTPRPNIRILRAHKGRATTPIRVACDAFTFTSHARPHQDPDQAQRAVGLRLVAISVAAARAATSTAVARAAAAAAAAAAAVGATRTTCIGCC